MKCPNCNETLVMSERQGVEIDYCPACRGVWLDKGELDKIIEKAAENESRIYGNFERDNRPQQNPYDKNQGYGYKKKKRGFLGDFLDFD